MARTGHTPGPWTVSEEQHQYGDHPATTATRYSVQTAGRRIAILPMPNDEANAHLIAICPTMYDYIHHRAAQGDQEAQIILKTLD